MRKRIHALAFATLLGVTTVAPLARADRLENKLFVEFGLGGGLTIGKHSWSANDYLGHTTNASEMLSGPMLDLTLTPALAVSHFAFGVMFDAWLTIPDGAYGGMDHCAILGSASAIAMTRAKSGLGAAVALGYASAGKTCSQSLLYSGGYVSYSNERMGGPIASARFGFTTLSGMGFVTTASYAYLWGEGSSYAPLSLVMQIMVSGW